MYTVFAEIFVRLNDLYHATLGSATDKRVASPENHIYQKLQYDWRHPEISINVLVDYSASDADSRAQLGPLARRT